MSKPVIVTDKSAEKDDFGKEYLAEEPWQKMGTQTVSSRATAYLDKMVRKVTGDLEGEDLLRVLWLSSTLFFIVGGYWLLRSLKDPIMSVINGVSNWMHVVVNPVAALTQQLNEYLGGVYTAGKDSIFIRRVRTGHSM